MNPPSSANSQAGVALLEVLVAILIFSFGVLGLVGLQARAIGFSVDAEDRNRAALLANEIASSMWLNNSIVVDTSAGGPWATRVADTSVGGLPAGTVAVVAAGTPNSVDITINWRAPQRTGGEQTSQLITRVTLPPP